MITHLSNFNVLILRSHVNFASSVRGCQKLYSNFSEALVSHVIRHLDLLFLIFLQIWHPLLHMVTICKKCCLLFLSFNFGGVEWTKETNHLYSSTFQKMDTHTILKYAYAFYLSFWKIPTRRGVTKDCRTTKTPLAPLFQTENSVFPRLQFRIVNSRNEVRWEGFFLFHYLLCFFPSSLLLIGMKSNSRNVILRTVCLFWERIFFFFNVSQFSFTCMQRIFQ